MKLTFQLGETDNEQIRKIYRMAVADKSCGEKESKKLEREIGAPGKGVAILIEWSGKTHDKGTFEL